MISSDDAARLERILRTNAAIAAILARFDAIALPDAWLVAGCLAQTVWSHTTGRPAGAGIRDIDLVYHDAADLSEESENARALRLRALFADLPEKLDVKNQARVHLWYERRFGRAISPYPSTAAAIATFPATATALGVQQSGSQFRVCAPFGLADLFSLTVRANPVLVSREVYEAKAARWRTEWPMLTVLPWPGCPACAPV
jgi:hypothetical protein